MNFKLLAATTLLLTTGTAMPAFSADEKELATFLRTRQCVNCNLSSISHANGSTMFKDFKNANLQGANLFSSKIMDSDLRDANLSHTNSKNTDFRRTDLRNSNFSHADVSGADFCDADLRGVNWTNVIYNKETRCLPNEAVNYVPTANNSAPATYATPAVNVVSPEYVAPAVTEDPISIKDTVNSVRENVNTVRDILNIFR